MSAPACPKCGEPMRELACIECHVCDACSPAWGGIGSCHEKRPAVGFVYECAPVGFKPEEASDAN